MNEQEIKDQLKEELDNLTDNAFTVLRLMSMVGELTTLAHQRGVEDMASKLLSND